MPSRTPRACRKPGCPGSTTAKHGYCDEHAHLYKPFSSGRAGRGRGGRPWRRIRERIAKRAKYLCEECKRNGVIRPGVICDHIIPEAEGGRTTDDNLQWLCQDCSDKKTQQESQQARQRNIGQG